MAAKTVKIKAPNAKQRAVQQYRMPAEWEPHEATWIAWPHYERDWPGRFEPIPMAMAEVVRHVFTGEIVRILVNSKLHEAGARKLLGQVGVDLKRVEFLRIPTDRAWIRDFGPIFVKCDAPKPAVAVSRFGFNAWAKYPNWQRDSQVAGRAAEAVKRKVFDALVDGRRFILEGGSIDVNGFGSLITTEECLLDPEVQTRNPGFGKKEIEDVLREFLAVRNVLWLGKGVVGDDTHGHVDDICRFVDPRTAVLCWERDPHDVNYKALQENWERMQGMHLEDGSKIEVVPLPMPSPVIFDGKRLPASYANFYISNAAVLVPTFNDPRDIIALGTLGELFRGRPVVGIHALDLVWGLGTVHCLTQQQPAV